MRIITIGALCAVAVALTGCSPAESLDPPAAEVSATSELATTSEAADVAAMAADPRLVVVHKDESCGCCHLWVEHLQKSGFQVRVRNVTDLGGIKERVGVPYGMGSCHTARVGGYFIEGHVPAADIVRLLEQKPDAKGLTVPGMPAGSPGMELPSGEVQPYDVHLVARDGSTTVFMHHGEEPPSSGNKTIGEK
jgi:hypothetical protein